MPAIVVWHPQGSLWFMFPKREFASPSDLAQFRKSAAKTLEAIGFRFLDVFCGFVAPEGRNENSPALKRRAIIKCPFRDNPKAAIPTKNVEEPSKPT